MQEQNAKELLFGAYDLHIHAAPSPFERLMNEIELIQSAGRAGMAGILLKSHYESTAARAEMANRYGNSPAKAYGSIALNWPVGGLNPFAVRNALKHGAKIVFMPTRDAENSLKSGNMPGDFFDRPGISILDASGRLKSEVEEILAIVHEFDAALATGHLSPEESLLLCREGIKKGVRMILTHPEFPRTKVPQDIQAQLAREGVLIEHCWYNLAEGECSAEEMAGNIRLAGADHCFMSTDRGQGNREKPAEGLRLFIETLLKAGISTEEITAMTHTVPQKALGIND